MYQEGKRNATIITTNLTIDGIATYGQAGDGSDSRALFGNHNDKR